MRRIVRHVRTNGERSGGVSYALRPLGRAVPARTPPLEYRFGPFTVQPDERRLMGHAGVLSMAPRAFDLLLFLLQNAGHLVSKDNLLAAVWSGVVVEEANLHVQVSALRRILGQAVIETVPRHGYRFCADVVLRPREVARANVLRPPSGAAAELDRDLNDAWS